MDGAVATVTSDAARVGSRAAPRGRATRDADDVDSVAAMRDVRALMSSRGRLWRGEPAKARESRRRCSTG